MQVFSPKRLGLPFFYRFSTLVLLRHGESQWNLENRFTGWVDVPLSPSGISYHHFSSLIEFSSFNFCIFNQGTKEAIKAGENLKKNGYKFDVVFTSVLKRAISTYNSVSESLDCMGLPVHKSWRLNERHYGQLQGMNKKETSQKHGEKQVLLWRRSYDIPPPLVELTDKNFPGNDEKYKLIDKNALPRGESLKLTSERVLPYWYDNIAPELIAGKKVLVVAHGNSLRAIVKYLSKISDNGFFFLFNIIIFNFFVFCRYC